MSSSGASKPLPRLAPAKPGDPSTAPNGSEATPVEEQPATTSIRVILADTQAIYRVGTKKIFALEDDIRVVAQAETLGQLLAAAQKFPNDVILIEAAITTNPQEGVSELLKRVPTGKVIVLTPEADEDDTVEYFRRGVRGLINRAISPDMLVKCVRKFAGG